MSALQAFLTVGGIVLLGIGIRLGFDFSRHARLRRMAEAARGVQPFGSEPRDADQSSALRQRKGGGE